MFLLPILSFKGWSILIVNLGGFKLTLLTCLSMPVGEFPDWIDGGGRPTWYVDSAIL